MAITSGVRAPRAQIMIGGQSFNVLSARVNQEATRRSSTMSASCAMNTFPGGDAFLPGYRIILVLSPLSRSSQANGTRGELATASRSSK